jgi:hypothetical protein
MFASARKRRSRCYGAALRVWLVLALWPTPLPWWHAHAEDDGPRLAAHLNEYHHEGEEQGHCSGWHLHFAYLWDLTEDHESPRDPECPPPHELPAIACVAPAPILSAPAAALDAAIDGSASDAAVSNTSCKQEVARRAAAPDGFLNSFLGDIAPHQLIGVLLC